VMTDFLDKNGRFFGDSSPMFMALSVALLHQALTHASREVSPLRKHSNFI
jgi:hypothetical protein